MVFRHRRRAAIAFISVVVAGLVYIALAPRTYRSEGRLYLRLGRENSTLDSITTMRTDPTVVVPQSRESELNSAVDILNSRHMAESVVNALGASVILGNAPLVDDTGVAANAPKSKGLFSSIKQVIRASMVTLGLSDKLEEKEVAILELSGGLLVSRKRDSNVIDIAFDCDSPKLSQAVVDCLMNNFVQYHIKMNRSEGAHSFLSEQKDELLSALTKAEENVRNLQATTGLVSPVEQRRALVAQIASLEDETRKTQASLASVESEIAMLEKMLMVIPQNQVISSMDGMSNQGTDGIRQQFYALKVQEQGLASKFTNTHPSLVAVRKQIADAEAIMKAEQASQKHVTTGVNREYEEVTLTLSRRRPEQIANQTKLATLESQLSSVLKKLEELSENELLLTRAEREVEARNGDYKKYVSALEQARIEEALSAERISNIQIAQHGSFQPRPIKPQKPLLAALTLAMALACSFLVALGSEYLTIFGRKEPGSEMAASDDGVAGFVISHNLTRNTDGVSVLKQKTGA
jgi:uncharacterized protein involved in exopolysaccharide biosynthesis